MKKSFGIYTVGWLAALAMFNIITFVPPADFGGGDRFDSAFWISYVFITVAFIGQLACAYFIFNAKKLESTFYNLPLYKISVGGLVAMTIVGGIFMAVDVLPEWLAVIVCFGIIIYNVIAVSKVVMASSAVTDIDKKVKVKTFFVKMLTADAEVLMKNNASNPEFSALTQKVYEAIRYSDPMSDDALESVESRITAHFNTFSQAVAEGNLASATNLADRLQNLINERNTKCKILK